MIGVAFWIQVAVTCAATLYLSHLCRLAYLRQSARAEAFITAASVPVCRLRDVAQTLHEIAHGSLDAPGAAQLTKAQVAEAIGDVLAIRLFALPTRAATEAAARAIETARRLKELVDNPPLSDAALAGRATTLWRNLVDVCISLERERAEVGPKLLRGGRPPKEAGFGSRASGRLGWAATDALISVRDMGGLKPSVASTAEDSSRGGDSAASDQLA